MLVCGRTYYIVGHGKAQMCALTNSEDPDEMPPNAAFHQCPHYLLRQN